MTGLGLLVDRIRSAVTPAPPVPLEPPLPPREEQVIVDIETARRRRRGSR